MNNDKVTKRNKADEEIVKATVKQISEERAIISKAIADGKKMGYNEKSIKALTDERISEYRRKNGKD